MHNKAVIAGFQTMLMSIKRRTNVLQNWLPKGSKNAEIHFRPGGGVGVAPVSYWGFGGPQAPRLFCVSTICTPPPPPQNPAYGPEDCSNYSPGV